MEKVICDVCKTEFTDCFSPETNQAYGCASDFYQDEKGTSVLCHYGSSYDTSKSQFYHSSCQQRSFSVNIRRSNEGVQNTYLV